MLMPRAVLLLFLLALSVFHFQSPVAVAAPADQTAALDRIVLDISPQQVVGRSLVGNARILLYDETGALLPTYDLSLHPITLTPSQGSLAPNVLNNPGLVNNGEINLGQIAVTYTGPSGQIAVTAQTDSITSSPVLISFNGYDIINIIDFKGDSVTHVFSSQAITVRAIVRNGGTRLANSNPALSAFFASPGGGSTRVFFAPDDSGAVDTVPINLPTSGLVTGLDTLVLDLESIYRIDTVNYTTRSRTRLPVTVLPLATVGLIAGSVKPDSVNVGAEFPISMEFAAAGFAGEIDSAFLRLDLNTGVSTPTVATIYLGPVTHTSFQNSIITYDSILAEVPLAAGLLPGWYRFRMTYNLISGGTIFTVNGTQLDSLYILPFTVPQYIPGSLKPDTVAAGSLSDFTFDLAVTAEDELNVDSTPGTATFTVSGSGGFLATGNLIIPDRRLQPGLNVIATERVFIPAAQLNQNLQVSARFRYATGSAPFQQYTTDFDAEAVRVQELPVAQITNTELLAPNTPKVNIDQVFQISVSVANLSNVPLENLILRLASDVDGEDTLVDTIALIPPQDTSDVLFDIPATGADPDDTLLADPDKLFRADIISTNHGQVQPVDNVAVAQVQTRAHAQLSGSLSLPSADVHYVKTGALFSLIVNLSNRGQAALGLGSYRLSSEGVRLGLPNSTRDTIGTISDQTPLTFQLRAPSTDTTFVLSFTLTNRPLDLNTGNPAAMQSDTSFQYVIAAVSSDAALSVSVEPVPLSPLYHATMASLFQLRLGNVAQTVTSMIAIDSIILHTVNAAGQPLPATTVLDIGSFGAYDNTTLLGGAASVGDRIKIIFDNLQIDPQEELTLAFSSIVVADIGETFGLRLDTSGIYASYADGPSAGERIPISSPPNGAYIFSRTYAVTGASLEQSFVIQHNPWHPENGPARFAYALQQASAIDFRVFTLGGEQVFMAHFNEGSSFTGQGQHILEWDGRNGEGHVVMDGVYIVSLTVARTGEEARIKVAVLK